jgi:aspartyl-tRNA(Asn)/glutamyl-tRNA(Gln) amidotransferase subunit C
MPRISLEEVERIASLARLSLSRPEAAQFAGELDTILGYVETLSGLDTEGVEATCHVIPLATPLREDRAVEPMPSELALANAPEHEGSAFVVPKVIDGEEDG